MIKRALICLLIAMAPAYGADQKKSMIETKDVVHVATSLNHLTVFELGEPVTNAAVGSSAFQVEWKDSRVYVKPLKIGASTDLFIWTGSQRHDYELDPPGDVKDMNFVVENATPTPTPQLLSSAPSQMEELTDAVVTKAILGIDRVDHSDIKDAKRGVTVRVEDVFESKTAIYVRYSIVNLGDRPYRVVTPNVTRIVADHPDFSLIPRRNSQLDAGQIQRLGSTQRTALSAAKGESRQVDLKAGDRTDGVVVIRNTTTGLAVLELSFGSYGNQSVGAVFVF